MPDKAYLLPADRGVLSVAGPDARAFLQGLVSNDLDKVTAGRAVYAALLTAQGRFLHDFLIAELGGVLRLDCEAARLADLLRRLSLYRLRSKVELADAGADLCVALLFGESALETLRLPAEPGSTAAFAGGIAFVDPRLAALGARAILPRSGAEERLAAAGFSPGVAEDYERLRLTLGVPDGSRDMPVEKAILLENGFEELNGVDWQKGCYLGQELTARTKYRGVVRKRLVPVAIDGPVPQWGTPVMLGGNEAGEMRSALPGVGLALLRLECLDPPPPAGALTAGSARLTPRKPDWATF